MIDRNRMGDVLMITLNRPTSRNALTTDGLESLERTLHELEDADVTTDGDSRAQPTDAQPPSVVYLEGAGSAFCAGADLDTVADLDREGAVAFAELGQRIASALESLPAITVAGIDGAARGGGLELALACDLRVATPSATFGEPGVTFGLFGAWGGTHRLPRIVGQGNALDLSCTGRVIDAETALRMGLVSQVTTEPRTVAETIAEHPPDTLEVLKTRLRDTENSRAQERRAAAAFGQLLEAHGPSIGARRDGRV